MRKCKLYDLNEGDKFRYCGRDGKPEENIYIKGEPHTIETFCLTTYHYATYIYAPGTKYDNDFTGYTCRDTDVFKIEPTE